MLRNYIKTTLRHLWRQRLFTILNVLGLAIGISASWIIYRMVDYEFSFDKGQPDSEQIFQIVSRASSSDGTEGGFAGVSKGLLSPLLNDISGLKAVVPMYYRYSETVTINKDQEKPLSFDNPEKQVGTLSSYFEMIPYKWLAGNSKTALDAPNKVVLTQKRAQRYFPDTPVQSALGKTIIYNDTLSVVVSGIVADLEYPSSFDAQEFFAISSQDLISDDWDEKNSDNLLYIKLANGGTPNAVLQQLNTINESYNKKNFEKYNYRTWYDALSLVDKHFAVEYGSNTRTANKKVLYGLIGIAVFLIALACINYINLSTAQIPQRAKEIGIRKTLGSTPAMLINRFLGETLTITLLAILLSFLFSFFAFRLFSDFIPEGMQDFVNYKGMIVFGVLLISIVTILSGIYPAWLITRVQTVNVLKGQVEKTNGGIRFNLRKCLIVFQFVVAQVFIISAVIIGQQLRYSLNKDFGFNHEAVLTIDVPFKIHINEEFKGRLSVLKQELEKHPEITAIALGELPMSDNMMATILTYQSDTGRIQQQVMFKNIDTDYIDLYNIPLLAGRNLQKSDTTREYIINEVALKAFGFPTPESAIGKQLTNYNDKNLPITGVVRDFHEFSLKSGIEPAAFISEKNNFRTLNIKLPSSQPDQWGKAIQVIETEWKKIYPGVPFEYKFYDETIASLYQQEQNTSKLVGAATGVTIFISCLGLFGLATLTAFQRTKEIGIRKVLGATVTGIVKILSKDFVKLVLIAIVIASPIAWWAMNQWLQDFAYRVQIQWWMFVMAGIIAVFIALLTVSSQALKAAIANPVDSLRDE
ncbi:ABC transporter permease [Albibacterium bauzanense]|uniref:Putative permease n=1 Tax=Albibacterium bauzanense TaxID=653929 RepID=A0A4V2PX37_9SPHI|nr:ABC transporter permease [Albibacterium bauzanense]TCK80561.1 putative permease [Albibacterium bauzanense]